MFRNDLREWLYTKVSTANFETQKKIKRKEYSDVNMFASDVELIFSNAITYNLDHSQIWEDAHILRVGYLYIFISVDIHRRH